MKWPIVLAFACTSTSALCQPVPSNPETVQAIPVSYADLNLGQSKDVDRLLWRIKSAAEAICFDGSHEPLDIAIPDRACFKGAVSDARRDVQLAVTHRADTSLLAAARIIVVRVP